MRLACDPSTSRITTPDSLEDTWQVPFSQPAASSGSVMADIENLLTIAALNPVDPVVASQPSGPTLDHILHNPIDQNPSDTYIATQNLHFQPRFDADNSHTEASQTQSLSPSQSPPQSPPQSSAPSKCTSQSLSQPEIYSHSPCDSNYSKSETDLQQDQTALKAAGKDDSDSFNNSDHSKSAVGKTRAEIRRARAARNRSSARRSRLRKKAETERDKEKALMVEKRNIALKEQVKQLHDKMVSLQRVVEALGLAHNIPKQ